MPRKKKHNRKGKTDEKRSLVGKQPPVTDKQLAELESDLAKKLEDEESIVEEDMRQRQMKIPSKKYTTDAPRREETEEDKMTGIGLFYRRFVSKVRKALK